MTPNVTNVLNLKSLEKQLKLYDARITVLQEEMDELQRLRSACHLLLGQAPQENASGEGAESTKLATGPKRTKNRLSARILDVLRESSEGLTADAILQELKTAGVPLSDDDSDATIESTLKKHPELFSLSDDNRWFGSENTSATASEQTN
jgi:hypothetical protein